MPLYHWVGKTLSGEVRRGEMEAADAKLVEARLRRLQITPLKVEERKESFLARFQPKKVSGGELAVFTRQLATMLESGLPLVQALEALASQQKNPYFREVIRKVKSSVEGGSSLADALREFPKVFDTLYCQMVEAGEAGGNLDTILSRLATYQEKIQAIKSKIKHAMMYPIVIIVVTILVLSVIMVFVIPKFAQMFAEAGQALPLPTQIVIAASNLTKRYFPFFVLGVIVLVFLLKRYYATERGRYQIDKLLLRLPLFGDLFHKSALARFSRTLSSLIASGVPLLQGLSIAGRVSGNRVIERVVEEVRVSVSEGQSIAEPMAVSGYFPHMVTQMISVGEATGALEQMLDKVADFYEDEVDRTVDTMSTLIEPILIVFLGGIIGSIIVSLYLPIFKLASVAGG
ncbi:type II secretion system F family protein [Thermosulfurimonas marina]|uniref:Type II secretion system F family protein n=1 Tax=Thermosulfurimonas marina TaxID=2047767 RepID=A0A6H1WUR2_9BACT|nr:type II secretion system F family protein [Thermosulfurimonas marina]QJA06894.1 type II secretion system F family protein [Thermosulfurimonas marina]